jgi:hypothetical protein
MMRSKRTTGNDFTPDEWLCAALSTGDAAKNFKILEVKERGSVGSAVRVLHKESGAVWVFTCAVARSAAS